MSHRLLALAYRPNGLPHNRYAYATPRRIGGAVQRNRLRRRLRAALRALPLRGGHDLVVMARAASAQASYMELERAIEHCSRRASLLDAQVHRSALHNAAQSP